MPIAAAQDVNRAADLGARAARRGGADLRLLRVPAFEPNGLRAQRIPGFINGGGFLAIASGNPDPRVETGGHRRERSVIHHLQVPGTDGFGFPRHRFDDLAILIMEFDVGFQIPVILPNQHVADSCQIGKRLPAESRRPPDKAQGPHPLRQEPQQPVVILRRGPGKRREIPGSVPLDGSHRAPRPEFVRTGVEIREFDPVELRHRLVEQGDLSADAQSVDRGLAGGGSHAQPVDGNVVRQIGIGVGRTVVFVLEINGGLLPLREHPLAVGERNHHVVKGLRGKAGTNGGETGGQGKNAAHGNGIE